MLYHKRHQRGRMARWNSTCLVLVPRAPSNSTEWFGKCPGEPANHDVLLEGAMELRVSQQ
ncbi:hypothetical protein JZ751_024368 [Albula glossodonta]|uniref:Uncharacterized protein n=1 Tax=Albula glossodonta TaxID=121402 RepID=A0A8T2NG46_9TELE|nr:hypothetical protein JZ751_024368 [Albula glossodonta]